MSNYPLIHVGYYRHRSTGIQPHPPPFPYNTPGTEWNGRNGSIYICMEQRWKYSIHYRTCGKHVHSNNNRWKRLYSIKQRDSNRAGCPTRCHLNRLHQYFVQRRCNGYSIHFYCWWYLALYIFMGWCHGTDQCQCFCIDSWNLSHLCYRQ